MKVQFGEYGLKALEGGWLTNRQIEAARVAMTRKIKRGGKVWINVFPDKPITKKPAETRMGSGKGSPEGWVAVVKPGRVMFELAGVTEPLARDAITYLKLHGSIAAKPFLWQQLQHWHEKLVASEAEKNAKTDRSIPIDDSTTTTVNVTSTMRISLPIST